MNVKVSYEGTEYLNQELNIEDIPGGKEYLANRDNKPLPEQEINVTFEEELDNFEIEI